MTDFSGRKVFKVFNQDFVVDERYTVTKELGQGAYGIVCAAVNNQTNEGVAIKKITNVFSKKILAKRALREIKLLQHFRGHRNITCLYDMDIPRPDNFNETYLYEVRTIPGATGQSGGPGQTPGQVPMPQGDNQWTAEDPRPQPQGYAAQAANGLEQDLARG
ncbi:Mitogen-activated protein kinase-like protein [Hapsidospora chrysogenum ATCC 11550]|uniref:Mitogen-activated protein kinase-like protein n=1 Tax=Hapsidospora chrysogenum (strain ATCC 11550 / CBS 779.69 / DSM 880 / IAM 14645 / JCM 23072 / IMI 49137) TaxID=857340 RepID=A0A086T9Y7_HAPC1|nr:Mitogen-activated protein kinase-like protein [Hapsidospora chrysogenum ATCC 11550]